MSPIFWVAIGFILGATSDVGLRILIPSRRRKKTDNPDPICMCEHHYGTHHPETGVCHARWTEQTYDSRRGTYNEQRACDCLRYVGPLPLDLTWIAPTANHVTGLPPQREVEQPGKKDGER